MERVSCFVTPMEVLPLVLVNMMDGEGTASWRSAAALASVGRELREESKPSRELAALHWVFSARSAMGQLMRDLRRMPNPLAGDFCTHAVERVYRGLLALVDAVRAQDEICAFIRDDEAPECATKLLSFLLRTRDRLRTMCDILTAEWARCGRARPSPFNLAGIAVLALESFEYGLGFRESRPFYHAHFQPLGN